MKRAEVRNLRILKHYLGRLTERISVNHNSIVGERKALEMAHILFDKATPKYCTNDGRCPGCGNLELISESTGSSFDYCPDCGEALLWTDNEGKDIYD